MGRKKFRVAHYCLKLCSSIELFSSSHVNLLTLIDFWTALDALIFNSIIILLAVVVEVEAVVVVGIIHVKFT